MAKCQLCGKKPTFGNNVSHAHNLTRRMWKPNIQKATLTLEFIDSKLKDPPKGAAVTAQQTDFAAEMSPYSAVIDDALVTTLSSKASADLLKPDGKDQLKNDLMNNVNHALRDEEKVVNVYFTSFIIQ